MELAAHQVPVLLEEAAQTVATVATAKVEAKEAV